MEHRRERDRATSASGPAPFDFDSLVISSIDWDVAWQGQQEISTRLARGGSRVLFVENTAARGARPSDAGRIIRRVRKWLSPARSARRVDIGVSLFSPIVLPFPWQRWTRPLNRLAFVSVLARKASALRRPVIWAFLPTPIVVDAVRACRRPESVVIYYCVADFSEVADDPRALRRSERELIDLADLVFVNGSVLRDRFSPVHPRVRVYPFGVNLKAFTVAPGVTQPADLARIPRPRAGYVGGLHRHLATDWLAAAARTLPSVSFVLIGPRQADAPTGPLDALPNVHFLGQREHDLLPAYMSGFDVGLIPYELNAYTRSAVPTKLFEYLAARVPVVSTALPEVLGLPLGRTAIRIAHDAEELTRAIRDFVEGPRDEAALAESRRVAQLYSWDSQFSKMIADIDQARRSPGRADKGA